MKDGINLDYIDLIYKRIFCENVLIPTQEIQPSKAKMDFFLVFGNQTWSIPNNIFVSYRYQNMHMHNNMHTK